MIQGLLLVGLVQCTCAGTPPLAQWEEYLTPYLDDLVNVRDSPQGQRMIFLSNVVDTVPTWLEDLFIPLFIPGSELTIPINKEIPLSVPVGPVKIPLPASVTIKDLTLKDLNKFKELRPLKLRNDAMFSWQSDISMSKVALDLRVGLTVLGKEVEVTLTVDATDPELHFLLVAAFRRTELCQTWGALMFSSAHCAVWPMFVDAEARKAGFKFENFQVAVSDFHFSMQITGLGAEDASTLESELTDLMTQVKPKLLADMGTSTSDFLRGVLNELLLDGVDMMQKTRPCEVETWDEIDHYVNVSRVCIVNNGGFAVKFAYHNCPAHQYHEASGTFPADVKECRDVKDIYPDAIEGQPLRAATVATAGLHEILDPAIRYVPDSNVASWECAVDGRGTYNYDCKLLSVAPVNPQSLPEASEVCVINHAGFVMSFDLKNDRTGTTSTHSGQYPINQQQCLSLSELSDVQDGDQVTTEIFAIGGKTDETNRKVVFRDNGLKVSFQCKGGTFDYSCDILTSVRPTEMVV
jgi:hypothetical protein